MRLRCLAHITAATLATAGQASARLCLATSPTWTPSLHFSVTIFVGLVLAIRFGHTERVTDRPGALA